MSEPEPQTYFDVLMMQAAQAHERRQWATLAMLLWQAREAPDVPPWDDERQDVQIWHELRTAVVLHQGRAHALIRAGVYLLLTRLQERCGAVGAPDPTTQDLCGWLRTEVERPDMELVEEAVEERWRGADISRQFLRTNAQRDNSWHWKRMGEDLSA
jgi:hypothetical protein